MAEIEVRVEAGGVQRPDRRLKAVFSLSRVTAISLALLLAGAWPVTQAQAHAYLVHSDPPSGAALASPPAAILLMYSEDLEPSLSSVQLLDSAGHVVAPGPGVIEPQDPRSLRLTVPKLADGVYSAVWQTRSAVDGHDAQGTVSFSVGGEGSEVGALLAELPPPGAPDPATAFPDALGTLLRWINYISAACLLGGLGFAMLVWRPAFGGKEPVLEADGRISAILRRIIAGGAAGVAMATILTVLVQGLTGGRSGAAWDSLYIIDFLGGRAGFVLGVRFGLLIVLSLAVAWLPGASSGKSAGWWMALLLGAALLATFSVQGHSAAQNGTVGAALDWLHLTAMGTWLGGLLPLALALRIGRQDPEMPPLSVLVPRFSRVALPCVAVLGATGLLNAVPLVQTWAALTQTTQGRALLVKTALFGILILLGAVNLLILSPHLVRSVPKAGIHLSRTVQMELLLGLLVLLATSVVTGVAPAREALLARERQGPVRQVHVGPVDMTLRLVPGTLGSNAFGVDIADSRSGAEQAPGQVLLRLSMPAEEAMGVTEVATTTRDGRRYTAAGSYLTRAGVWQVEVIWRRPGFDDVQQSFEFPIEVEARLPSTAVGASR